MSTYDDDDDDEESAKQSNREKNTSWDLMMHIITRIWKKEAEMCFLAKKNIKNIQICVYLGSD